MIDLSHLTEEEQGMIMTVLRRDAELKKAEEERIRKLEKILNSSSQSESNLKYLTGEWFYEAKSRRHMDKIHGSEIILASMKQRKDGSLRVEKSNSSSSRGSDIVAPPKPARSFDARQPQQINDAVKDNRNSEARSPRTPRQNPFNRASLIVVEPPENNDDVPTSQDHEWSETESTMKNHIPEENNQTSGGSIRSESSSVGFMPVPKKRTFLPRRPGGPSESNDLGLDARVGAAGLVPAPRRILHHGSTGSSDQSCLKSQDEMPPKSAYLVYPLGNESQVNSSLDLHTSRPATHVRGDASPERETPQRSDDGDVQTRGEQAGMNTVVLFTGSIQDSDRANSSSEGTSMRLEDLSLTQKTQDPDPPVSYDLNFIDKSDEQAQRKSGQTHAFKLSTQASSPTGDEDSIAKVLDWFSRSTDSNDWLADDGPAATKSSVENNKLRSEDSLRKDVGDLTERKDTADVKRNRFQRNTNEAKELRGTDKMGDKELSEVRDEAQKDTRERMKVRDLEHDDAETQSPKISNLKSFWEKNNQGPKILVRNPVTPSNEVQRAKVTAEKDEGNKPHTASNMNSAPGMSNGRGTHDKYASKHGVERDQQLVVSPHKAVTNTVSQKNNNDPTYISNYSKLPSSPHVAERGASDAQVFHVTRLGPQSNTDIESRLSPESEAVPSLKPDAVAQSRENPVQVVSQADTDVQKRVHRGSGDEVKRRDSQDRNMSPRRKEDPSNKDRGNTAEKIKQLKSFWEQERKKSIFYSPNSPADGRVVVRGTNQEKLTKRFTKSEYDLRLAGNDSGSGEEDSSRNHHNFTVLPLSQRMEKLSPSLSTSRTQFSTLREFWDDTVSDKPKSPRRKEPLSPKPPCQEYKKYGDSEMNCPPPAGEKTRPCVMKSSPSPQKRSKSPHGRQTGPGSRVVTDGKNNLSGSRDAGREEKSTKSQNNAGKEARSPKGRSNGHGNSLRRVTSMFTLSVSDEYDREDLNMDVSPTHFQSRKQRQNADKGAMSRRSSEGTDSSTLARAFVPSDYRHYLGTADDAGVQRSFAPAVTDDDSRGKSGFDFDVGGPVRTSTPVSSEERHGRKGNKMSQCPLWANQSSSDTGQESSLSSTSETWSTSRNSSNREKDHDTHHPVKKALKRAEARPKHLAKSIEDITNASSPRQERDQDSAAEIRRIRDGSFIPSPSSSSFSDPDHLKKMSKSVPSFLEKEDASNDVDSTFEDSFGRGRLTMGSSMSNLTNSSGVASRSGSVTTMYSVDFGNVEVQGNIQFSINYVQKLREFHIFVAECQDLAAVDPKRGRSDPYVKSYLVPDKENLGKRKTSVKKKTLNPTFNEILRYRVRIDYLRAQTLILSVWHHDTFGRNSFLGEVDVDLSKWDFDHTQMNYLALKAKTTPTAAPVNGRGEMRLAIRFLPQITHSEGVGKDGPNSGEVHIWVKECKNLPLIRATIDPYVKCFVLPDTSRKSRQKTRMLRKTADPVFNHTMVYDGISETDLSEACVELTVWDRDRLASNLLGGLRLGLGTGKSYGAAVDWMDSGPYEVALWERMMASPDQWVEDVLPLRMVNSARTAFK